MDEERGASQDSGECGKPAGSLVSRLVRAAILAIYRRQGWRIEGHLPDLPKFVIAGAPHTSNWDFVFFTGATAEEGVEPSFLGKKQLFSWPMGRFMRDMGGIAIDRSRRANYVEQVAEHFARREKLALVIAPEGTRSSKGEWKSGFYHIARAAGVPIVPAWACQRRKLLGFGEPIWPSGDYGEDLLKIARFLRARWPDFDRFARLEQQALKIVAGGGKDG